jgi:Domain of unknown function (DUF4386)
MAPECSPQETGRTPEGKEVAPLVRHVRALIHGELPPPKLLGVPVMVAGVGYLFDSFMQLLFPGFAMVSQFTAIAELPLPLWLLIRGGNVERWQRAAVA